MIQGTTFSVIKNLTLISGISFKKRFRPKLKNFSLICGTLLYGIKQHKKLLKRDTRSHYPKRASTLRLQRRHHPYIGHSDVFSICTRFVLTL